MKAAFDSPAEAYKEQQIQLIMNLPGNRPVIKEVLGIKPVINDLKYHLGTSAMGKSYEGQLLTGSKLIINGVILLIIEYCSVSPHNSVLSAHFLIPFILSVELGNEIGINFGYEVASIIEDVYVRLLNQRQIYVSILQLMKVQPKKI